ncbi:unnamed protein product [Mytilus coruscus]|uniref:B box-type domain-containing protein n=1 Tax=Mytilus coruscus TaxID=42192 RepID=A0A6J8DR43_MYTCO|nr:unnamed protein product [Mytilus coruscus]
MATNDAYICEQCSRGDITSPGSSWCSECEEILCTPCNRIHLLDVSNAIPQLAKTFDSIIKTRQKNIEAVNSQETVIKESIVKLKADLLKDVDLLEKSLLYDLCILREETIAKIDESVNEVSEINDKWSKIKEELDFNIEYGSNSQLFILAEKIKHKLTETEVKLLDMLSKMVNIDIKYCVKEDFSNIISNLSAIKTEYSQCGICHSTQMQERAQFVPAMLSLKLVNVIDLKEHGITSITGVEIVQTNRLLCCCYYSNKLFKYTDDGTYLKERSFDTRPYQIASTPTHNQVAVTMPDSKCILIIDIDSLMSIRLLTTCKT